jgi:alanine dehydrogenase
MLIGVPKEIKVREYRVGLVPASVKEVVLHGHDVIVQHDAGAGIGVSDKEYQAAGAKIIASPEEIFAQAEMIVKVKEPQPKECEMLRGGQILFTYLHLAPDPKQAMGLKKSGCTAIAYETVTDNNGRLPLLAPMSEVAGRLAIQAGAHCLEKEQGGSGILLGGVAGVAPASVVILGGGVVGLNAARMAAGFGARVFLLDNSIRRLEEIDTLFAPKITTIFSNKVNIENYVLQADLVVGAILVAGAATPKIVTKNMLKKMRPGSVLVDVSIDQGGCFETSRPTTYDNPIFIEEGIVHYCVANMPGAVPRTSAFALNNATLPFVLALANKGYKQALLDDPNLLNGLNVHKGLITYKAVAEALQCKYVPPKEAIA